MQYDLPNHPPHSVVDSDETDLESVEASTPVEFDGEWTTWGELMLGDKHTVRRGPDGVLRGGYPF